MLTTYMQDCKYSWLTLAEAWPIFSTTSLNHSWLVMPCSLKKTKLVVECLCTIKGSYFPNFLPVTLVMVFGRRELTSKENSIASLVFVLENVYW